ARRVAADHDRTNQRSTGLRHRAASCSAKSRRNQAAGSRPPSIERLAATVKRPQIDRPRSPSTDGVESPFGISGTRAYAHPQPGPTPTPCRRRPGRPECGAAVGAPWPAENQIALLDLNRDPKLAGGESAIDRGEGHWRTAHPDAPAAQSEEARAF